MYCCVRPPCHFWWGSSFHVGKGECLYAGKHLNAEKGTGENEQMGRRRPQLASSNGVCRSHYRRSVVQLYHRGLEERLRDLFKEAQCLLTSQAEPDRLLSLPNAGCTPLWLPTCMPVTLHRNQCTWDAGASSSITRSRFMDFPRKFAFSDDSCDD